MLINRYLVSTYFAPDTHTHTQNDKLVENTAPCIIEDILVLKVHKELKNKKEETNNLL